MFKRANARMYLVLVLAIVCIATLMIPAQATIIYVDLDATEGANDGTSWGDAFLDLQDALTTAVSGDEIWVANGTYKPTAGSDRSVSLSIDNGVGLYGGFNGTEENRSERDWVMNVTILSGDIGIEGDESDNSFHVVGAGNCVLDGFTITGGNADTHPSNVGGGIIGGTTLRNLIISDNYAEYGGGLYNGGSMTLINVTFLNNQAYYDGGGIYFQLDAIADVILTNVTFWGNEASGPFSSSHGGGMYFSTEYGQISNVTLINCMFYNNTAYATANFSYGGGMYFYTKSGITHNVTLINVTLSKNETYLPGFASGIYYDGSVNDEIKLDNCILWDDQIATYDVTPLISYSIIQGCGGSGAGWNSDIGTDGGHNIDADPLFEDGDNGDLRLSSISSPAYNAGNNEVPDLPATDLDGNIRIFGGTVDMGAYEFQPSSSCPPGPVVYVDSSATGMNDGTSWDDAFTQLHDAFAFLNCPGVTEIWVAKGTYKPTSGIIRGSSFQLVDDVGVYGGFLGNETSRSQRNLLLNETILSGDIGVIGDETDNCYHVVTGSGTGTPAVLDGFTITGGNANGSSIYEKGGGIYNDGGNDTLMNVTISNNAASQDGGGVYIINGSPIITNTVITKNIAANGGGMFNNASSNPTLTNVTFSKNVATDDGGGIYNESSSPMLINTILWEDIALSNGSEIYNSSSTPDISYSLIDGSGGSGLGWDGSLGDDNGGNLDANPLFIDAATGNLRLNLGSPAINAGDNSAPNLASTDLDGKPRILPAVGGTVDMGAYETDSYICPTGRLYVDAAVVGGTGDGSSWGNALTELRDALEIVLECPGITEIWVAGGMYKPTDTSDRNATFQLQSDLALHGGFAGWELHLNERDIAANPTILSGNIGLPGENADNCYHVITASGTDATAILDGFFISSGNASNGTNAGGGIYNSGGSPTISNVTVMVNSASNMGGGMYNYNGNATLINVVFWGNSAGYVGGGLGNMNSSPTLVNVTFYGNTAVNSGGGMANMTSGSTSLTNGILWGDSAPAIYNSGAATTYVSHSCIEGGLSAGCTDGGGNIYTDPQFVDAGVGNLRLGVGSPAIDAGDNSVPELPSKDRFGRPRIVGGTVDMGAFEFAMALCVLSPSTFDFGRVEVESINNASFTIKNIGDEPIIGNVIESCSDYSILSGDGPFSIDRYDSVNVDFQFLPGSNGFNSCLIETGSTICDRLVLLANSGGGLRIYNAKDPAVLTEVGSYNTAQIAKGVSVSGNYAYVADAIGSPGKSALIVFDISDPANPDSIAAYHITGYVWDVFVRGNYAYVSNRAEGMKIFDVSNPTSPDSVAHYDTEGANDIVVRGDYAYIADSNDGLEVVNISDPANPYFEGSLDTPNYAISVFVEGNYAYVADQDSGIQIIDISTPTSPTFAGSYDTPGSARDVIVEDGFAYVADWESGLLVLDVSVPTSPVLVGSYDTPYGTNDLCLSGTHIYVSDKWNGVGLGFHVIDISEPSNPVLVMTADTYGNSPTRIAVREGGDVACIGYAGYEHAVVNSVTDVPDDQGGYVRININRSIYDFAVERIIPIGSYQVWRRVDSPALLNAIAGGDLEKQEIGLKKTAGLGESGNMLPDLPLVELQGRYFLKAPAADVFPPGTWEFMHSVFAAQQENYLINTTTVADSSGSGIPYSVFVITAHTTTPSVWFTSPPDSGYSVDNIAPGVPQGFSVAYNTGSGNQLSWDPCADSDFQYFKVYRDTDPDFVPGPDNEMHATADTSWTDPEYDGWNVYYKITAIDHAGNESDAASPGSTTAVTEPRIPKVFALHQNIPNPFNPTTVIPYDVPQSGGHVTLRIYDVAGRLVRTLVDESQTPGEKRATWDARNNRGATVATGVYFYRMRAPGFVKTRKMVLLR